LQNGTAFFASTSLIAIGGALTLLRSNDEVMSVMSLLPFGAAPSRGLWDLKMMGLTIIFVYAFFKFAGSSIISPSWSEPRRPLTRKILPRRNFLRTEQRDFATTLAVISIAANARFSSRLVIWAGFWARCLSRCRPRASYS
jgi:hypothetical protein